VALKKKNHSPLRGCGSHCGKWYFRSCKSS